MKIPQRRRDLYRAGKHGDQVRVTIDTTEDRAIVLFRDPPDENGERKERKKKFRNTKQGRADAVAFGEGWFAERERIRKEQEKTQESAPVTVRELWNAFTASEFSSVVGEGLREATQKSYTQHFKHFAAFIGWDRPAESIKIIEVLNLREAQRQSGRALNQIRHTQSVIRLVFRWGIEHEVISKSPLIVLRWPKRTNAPRPLEPGEYTSVQHEALLRALNNSDKSQWKLWVYLVLAGYYGQRDRALRHLRWRDIDLEERTITFDELYQKQGKTLIRPISEEVLAALKVAKDWRDKELGAPPKRRNQSTRQTAERLAAADWILYSSQDKAQPITYQSMHYQLTKAEQRAGVTHQDFVAAHGLRRMVFGNVAEATGSRELALEWIGDRDLRVIQSYDRRSEERIKQIEEALQKASPNRPGGKASREPKNNTNP